MLQLMLIYIYIIYTVYTVMLGDELMVIDSVTYPVLDSVAQPVIGGRGWCPTVVVVKGWSDAPVQ